MTFVTLDPTNGPMGTASGFALAARPSTLKGETLGIIANGLGHSEQMFDALADELVKWDDLAGSIKVVKPSVAVPPWPEQWTQITEQASVRCSPALVDVVHAARGACAMRWISRWLGFRPCVSYTWLLCRPFRPCASLLALLAIRSWSSIIRTIQPAYGPPKSAIAMADQVIDAVRLRLTA